MSTAEILNHQGRILLNTRINAWEGRAPALAVLKAQRESDSTSVWNGWHPDWTITRHQPKVDVWAFSTHGSARKAHRVRYQLVATHKTGHTLKATVWKCAHRCASEIRITDKPGIARRCWLCSKT